MQVVVGTLTCDENVVDDDKQRENVNSLCKSPESTKDNKNIQNNAEKSYKHKYCGEKVSSKKGT